jgi:hypothetical protein
MYRFLLISGDKNLTARIKLALESVSTIMSADPAIDNVEELAAQFRPEGILVDSDIRMGARTAFERARSGQGVVSGAADDCHRQ